METAGVLENAARRAFRPHHLSPAQFNVLNLLAESKGGLRAGALARQLIVHPSNITRLLRNLMRTGLVAQVDNPADHRQVVVVLTPAGRARWGKANRDYQGALRAFDRAIPPVAREHGAAVLKKLHDISRELFR